MSSELSRSESLVLTLLLTIHSSPTHNSQMKNISAIQAKILSRNEVKYFVSAARTTGKTIAFTNGCFDILHEGHIYSLSQAAKEADILIVGLNSDVSVRKLKGEHRPYKQRTFKITNTRFLTNC